LCVQPHIGATILNVENTVRLNNDVHLAPTILVLEDDEALAAMFREALVDDGYAVDVALNAAEALQPRVPPALIVFDLNLGSERGEDIAAFLGQSLGRAIPLVAMSADPRAHERLHEHKEVVAFLRKPFDLDALLQIVAALTRDLLPQCQVAT
jgi:CheY-like chemotaxis protein